MGPFMDRVWLTGVVDEGMQLPEQESLDVAGIFCSIIARRRYLSRRARYYNGSTNAGVGSSP